MTIIETNKGQSYHPEKAKERKVIFAFVGPEGAGKSTHAKALADNLGIPILGMGDEFRRIAEEELDTELGRKCKEMLDEHRYSDEALFTEVFERVFKRGKFEKGFVAEGAFRAIWEPRVFKKLVDKYVKDAEIQVIFLRTSGWQSMERLKERNRSDDDQESSLKRLTYFYKDLGIKMKEARGVSTKFTIVATGGRSFEEVDSEILDKMGLKKVKGGEIKMSEKIRLHPVDRKIIKRIAKLDPSQRRDQVDQRIASIDDRMVSTFDTGEAFQRDMAFRRALEVFRQPASGGK